jgi:hypothetical protein
MSSDEAWDAVVAVEADSYNEGYAEGIKDARESDNKEGYREGMLKGFAIGFEAGFLSHTSEAILSERGKNKSSDEGKSHAVKIAEDLRQRASTLPPGNHPDCDFDNAISTMRALYRQLGTPNGPCPPKLSTGSEAPSHEW